MDRTGPDDAEATLVFMSWQRRKDLRLHVSRLGDDTLRLSDPGSPDEAMTVRRADGELARKLESELAGCYGEPAATAAMFLHYLEGGADDAAEDIVEGPGLAAADRAELRKVPEVGTLRLVRGYVADTSAILVSGPISSDSEDGAGRPVVRFVLARAGPAWRIRDVSIISAKAADQAGREFLAANPGAEEIYPPDSPGKKLSFRLAAPTGPRFDGLYLGDDVIKRYRNEFAAKGPGAAGDNSWKWFPVGEGVDTGQIVTAQHEGQVYALLAAGARYTMLSAGDQEPWGLKDTMVAPGGDGTPSVRISFDATGSRQFEALTGNISGHNLAILVDGLVIGAPVVRSRILEHAYITGTFTVSEARELSQALRAGMRTSGE
jgi:hypothetical protein